MSSKISISSSDGDVFIIDRRVAEMSIMLKDLLAGTHETDDVIPLSNVTSLILGRVIEFCEYHASNPIVGSPSFGHDAWDKNFCTSFELPILYQVSMAANYMDIKSLVDVCCKTVADMIKGKTTEELRTFFNIKNDFTPEEEEQVQRGA